MGDSTGQISRADGSSQRLFALSAANRRSFPKAPRAAASESAGRPRSSSASGHLSVSPQGCSVSHERKSPLRVNSDVQEASPLKPCRTDEDAADRRQPVDADANAADHAQRQCGEAGKAERAHTGKRAAYPNRGRSRGDGANNPTKITAKAAGRPEELTAGPWPLEIARRPALP